MSVTIHPSAIVDQGAQIGTGSRVWHFVHVCAGARIGQGVSLGQNKMELFKKYLHTYKTMPPEAFKEQFGDLPQ